MSNIAKIQSKLVAAQNCHPNAVQTLIAEALNALDEFAQSAPTLASMHQAIEEARSAATKNARVKEVVMRCKGGDVSLPIIRDHFGRVVVAPVTREQIEAIPPDHALVPAEPTKEMLEAFQRGFAKQLKRRKSYQNGNEMSAEQAGLIEMINEVIASQARAKHV